MDSSVGRAGGPAACAEFRRAQQAETETGTDSEARRSWRHGDEGESRRGSEVCKENEAAVERAKTEAGRRDGGVKREGSGVVGTYSDTSP